jgi:hypothetical protein
MWFKVTGIDTVVDLSKCSGFVCPVELPTAKIFRIICYEAGGKDLTISYINLADRTADWQRILNLTGAK